MGKIILGLVGEIASGKDTVGRHLVKKYGAKVISFSDPLRDTLDRFYLPKTRLNLANLGHTLRQTFGEDILSQTVAAEIKASKKQIIVLPNVRLRHDLKHLEHEPGFKLVAILTEQKTRFERLRKRRQNADDKTKTWQQFLADSELPTEKQIRKLAKEAEFSLDNNGSRAVLYRQVDQMMAKILKPRQTGRRN